MRINSLVVALSVILAPAIGLAHETHSSKVVSRITVYRVPTAVTTGALNLREGPGTSYRAISVLHRNTAVHLNGCTPSGHWCNVSTATATGWVSARYLTQTPAPIQGPVYGGTWPYPYASVVPYPYVTMPRAPGTSTIIYSQP
ncbi:MAG: SH3 domain-containing protein [Paracoccaceae bacterium]